MRRLTIVVMVLLFAACTGGSSPLASPNPTPGPTPTPGPALTLTDLKLALIDRLGPLWYCDPDFYPLQRQEEIDAAHERWAEVTADAAAYRAIAGSVGVDPDPTAKLDDTMTLEVYRAWKTLNAIALDPIGNETYRFDYLAQPSQPGGAQGTRTAGTIGSAGAITIEQQAAAGEPMCPICLARGTAVQTPDGPIAVEGLRIGDPVWTLDRQGRRIAGVVIAAGSTPAPPNHEVVRMVLADGRSVTASPGHPLADGRSVGSLRVGDALDGSVVVAADRLAYSGGSTFDIAVSGPTGIYLVDGIALGSTLRP